MRVTLVRGPRRVVDGEDCSPLGGVYGRVHAVCVVSVVSGLVVSGLDVSGDDGVVDDGPLMSVVTGGLVLVIVAVVVGVDEWLAVAENDGSTKFSGAWSGSPNWRATNVTAAMMMPTAAIAATLAPMTFGVRLYHGVSDDSSS
ncbi:hypothetical protein Mycsm_00363 [Mycobacterium sp. JS623]|uniref:hypothetical protein n=1 Tax=Mycobacterium sp. JS623 TaxID=212767 RepID=UPI0002A558F6|nr:hypothetical protein [Mycobacterium sp. JS623]AGB20816.1 hypothetical protein Mycsm_00363 [Mycobacterium sp. JS623]